MEKINGIFTSGNKLLGLMLFKHYEGTLLHICIVYMYRCIYLPTHLRLLIIPLSFNHDIVDKISGF